MNNHFIRQIKDTNTVLCVVKGVIKTRDKADIKHTDNTGGNVLLYTRPTCLFRFYSVSSLKQRFMIDTSLHSDTFFLLPANQSLLILLNTECLVEKQQIPSL
jgi:hypothetical protein